MPYAAVAGVSIAQEGTAGGVPAERVARGGGVSVRRPLCRLKWLGTCPISRLTYFENRIACSSATPVPPAKVR
jgi:hypothetical protein